MAQLLRNNVQLINNYELIQAAKHGVVEALPQFTQHA